MENFQGELDCHIDSLNRVMQFNFDRSQERKQRQLMADRIVVAHTRDVVNERKDGSVPTMPPGYVIYCQIFQTNELNSS